MFVLTNLFRYAKGKLAIRFDFIPLLLLTLKVFEILKIFNFCGSEVLFGITNLIVFTVLLEVGAFLLILREGVKACFETFKDLDFESRRE